MEVLSGLLYTKNRKKSGASCWPSGYCPWTLLASKRLATSWTKPEWSVCGQLRSDGAERVNRQCWSRAESSRANRQCWSRAEWDRRLPSELQLDGLRLKFSLPPRGSSLHLPCFSCSSARLDVNTWRLRYRSTFILAFEVKQPFVLGYNAPKLHSGLHR